VNPIDQKLKTAWKALQRDPDLAHRASVRLAAYRRLPCKQIENVEIFFPPPGSATIADKAKRLCADCPRLAQLDCLVTHLVNGSIEYYCVGFRASCNCGSYKSNQHQTPERAAEAGAQHVRTKHHGHVMITRYPTGASR